MMNVFALLLALGQIGAATPDLAAVRQLFESGKHAEVAALATTEQSEPQLVYLVSQSQAKLESAGAAEASRQLLTARPDTDPWHFIGRSATLLAQGMTAEAITAAQQAVEVGPTVAEAHYQLGLAHAEQRDYATAAPAFEASLAFDPQSASAHYYAGLSHYRAERIDLMARHFEAFLELAPDAPERPQVESIMRTVRGRR